MIEERNAQVSGYGGIAKSLHWLIVALIIAQFGIAWIMPGTRPGSQPETLTNLHLSIGVTIITIALLRLLWRVAHPVPLITDNVPAWQDWTARATHVLLYLLLFVVPLLGWADASSRGWSISLFGLGRIPPLLPIDSSWTDLLGNLHSFFAYSLLAIAGLHLAAALYHHFWLRDRVLTRMLPGGN
ncbi:MAG TPA: cytochrome b [Stellaceae bacterium]|jgi:cytochrome b561|nr:cytochrome b [Stellaceae bacterium]